MVTQAATWAALALWAALPEIAPRWVAAWVLCLALLVVLFHTAKWLMRRQVLALDERLRDWALRLRYPERTATNAVQRRERVALTWFFRFWTNFASAPCLSTLALLLPVAWGYRHLGELGTAGAVGAAPQGPHALSWWFLPGLCFLGAMGQSWVLKRVFQRVRPHREAGAFGHKMKDHSFPSGHSLTAFCFWSMFVVSLAHSSAAGLAPAMALLGAAIVALTGLSRVYLGVHYPSDVLGGYAIGALWSSACYLALHNAF